MSGQRTRNDVSYGSQRFDLSTPRTDELVQVPLVTSITVLKCEATASARFGDDNNAEVNLQDLNKLSFENPIDQLYLSNAAGSGTLEIVFGRRGVSADATTPNQVDITDRSGRNNGKTRLMDSGEVLIDPATAAAQGNWSGLEYGSTSVATSGTAEAVNGGTSLTVPDGVSLAIKAPTGNTDTVYIGDSSVTTTNGFPLEAGDGIELQPTDVANVYVDADSSGDGIRWIMEA